MKILICGGNGQLGNELLKLIESGQAEIGPVPDIYKGAEVVRTDVEELDITDAAAVMSFVEDGKFDIVLNCAAFTNVDGCEEKEDLAYKINAEGPKNLAIAAEAVGAILIHISTDYVFSGDEEREYTEDDVPSPQSAYGRTKLAGEQLVQAHASRYFIIRTAWLYGYIGPNFVKTMIKLAKENGHIKVVNDQFGNPTSANDLAYEILKLGATDAYGVYHCTNNGVCSWFDFASAIVDGVGIECGKEPCTTAEFPRPAKRPAFSPLKNARLAATIGDEMRPWQDALGEYLNNLNVEEIA